MKVLDLLSQPFEPHTRSHCLAPFPAAYKLLDPLETSLVIDVVTAAAFAIERLDALGGVELYEIVGGASLPDGQPARALRIALRRLGHGQYAQVPMAFHANLLLEPDAGGLEKDLRPICAEGFEEARQRAAQRAAPKLFSLPRGEALSPDEELLLGPNGAKPLG